MARPRLWGTVSPSGGPSETSKSHDLRKQTASPSGVSPVARVRKLAREKAPGPPSSHTEAHFLLAVLAIGETQNMGRQSLARRTGLGEGAVRTLLKRLREEGLVGVTKAGCELTREGRRLYQRIKEVIPSRLSLGTTKLTVGDKQTAILVRGVAAKVTNGIEQRDAATRAGAAGATTYLAGHSRFQIPTGSKDCERDYPNTAWKMLKEQLQPKDGDVVIVCGSSEELSSEIGAIAAALTLLT